MGGMTASLSLYVILAPFRHLGLNPISSGPGKSHYRKLEIHMDGNGVNQDVNEERFDSIWLADVDAR